MMRAGPARLAWLTQRAYAHRGLHGRDVPENSMAAFRAAIGAGFGIECDVRLSRDGVAHVFHDRSLDRLTGQAGRFSELDSPAIEKLRILGSKEAPPPLADLLDLCADAPLVVEIKSDGDPFALAPLCAAVAGDLARHDGPAAIMSFDPFVCGWFARHAPQVPRGLTTSRRYRHGTKALAIARARPHFLACDVRDLPGTTRPERLPLLCWTVRTARQRALAARQRAQIIFEG